MTIQEKSSGMPLGGAAAMVALAVLLTLLATNCLDFHAAAAGNEASPRTLSAAWIVRALGDLGQLALVVLAAGGLGYLAIRRLIPEDAPRGLGVVSAIALGLWMLATLVLAVGSLSHGLLIAWVFWPVLVVGAMAALWQARGSLEKVVFPKRVDGRALVWVLLGIAAGLWLSGATCPPGYCQLGGDGYDVLEYHLQVPREHLAAQHIGSLEHNCYSYYPMGTEMLYLLAMVLRGGAYEGMYLATLTHGMFLALAVAAVFVSLRREDDAQARFSMVLLGTAPLLLYLSFQAMVESVGDLLPGARNAVAAALAGGAVGQGGRDDRSGRRRCVRDEVPGGRFRGSADLCSHAVHGV